MMVKMGRVMPRAIPKEIHIMVKLKKERYCWMFRKVELRRNSQNSTGWKGFFEFGCDFSDCT